MKTAHRITKNLKLLHEIEDWFKKDCTVIPYCLVIAELDPFVNDVREVSRDIVDLLYREFQERGTIFERKNNE